MENYNAVAEAVYKCCEKTKFDSAFSRGRFGFDVNFGVGDNYISVHVSTRGEASFWRSVKGKKYGENTTISLEEALALIKTRFKEEGVEFVA